MRSLRDLKTGECALVALNGLEGALKARTECLGLIVDCEICCLFASPFGDPRAYEICGAVISLRHEQAQKILIR